MEAEKSFGLPSDAFEAAFPFHLVLNRDMEVVQSGPVIRRLCPSLVAGGPLKLHFQVRRPVAEASWEAFREHEHSLFLLEGNRPGLLLRGMILPLEGDTHLAFLGSPWVTTVDDLDGLGLSLHEFAVHDPIADLIFLLETKNRGISDTQMLAEQLRERLSVAERHVEGLSRDLATAADEARGPLHALIDALDGVARGRPLASDTARQLRDYANRLSGILDQALAAGRR